MAWIGHEYLEENNHSFWRSEFLALAQRYGIEYVADADFNYGSGRISQDLSNQLGSENATDLWVQINDLHEGQTR